MLTFFVKNRWLLLQKKARKVGKGRRFSELSAEQQITVLKKIETTQFFELVRTMTILGMFSDPGYGGNYNKIGWKMIGFEDQFFFNAPFGSYDRDYKAKE